MNVDTKWSVQEIQLAIYNQILGGIGRRALAIPNVSFGFFKYIECDLIAISSSNYLWEFEIKRSRHDFEADFKKPYFHNDERILKLSFVLPEKMAGQWLKDFCSQNYKTFSRPFNIYFYREDSDCCRIANLKGFPNEKFSSETYMTAEMIHEINSRCKRTARKITPKEKLKLLKLANYRFWNKQKTNAEKLQKLSSYIIDDQIKHGGKTTLGRDDIFSYACIKLEEENKSLKKQIKK